MVVPVNVGLATQELRYDLPNGANPTISYALDKTADGVIVYSYVITDAANSPQRTKRVSFLLPEHDTGLTADSGWELTAEDAF